MIFGQARQLGSGPNPARQVALGAVFPSPSFERTNKAISLVNAIGVVVLLLYSVFRIGNATNNIS